MDIKDQFIYWLNSNPNPCIYSLPTLSKVSSTMNSFIIFFLLFCSIFFGLYFWIQFHTETWFLLMNGNSLLEVFLNDKPEEYNCNAYRIYTLKLFCFYYTIRNVCCFKLYTLLSEQSLIGSVENSSKQSKSYLIQWRHIYIRWKRIKILCPNGQKMILQILKHSI